MTSIGRPIPSGMVIFRSESRPLTLTVDKPLISVDLNDREAIRYWEEQIYKVVMQQGLHFSKMNERETEVDGKPAIESVYLVTHSLYPPVKERFMLIAKDKTTYTLTFSTLSSFFDEANKAYFEPMLQSFKFEEHKGG